jgi:hypothetical protein
MAQWGNSPTYFFILLIKESEYKYRYKSENYMCTRCAGNKEKKGACKLKKEHYE